MRRLRRKLLLILCVMSLTITVIPIFNITTVLAQEPSQKTAASNSSEEVILPDIIYHAHIQNKGDQAEVKNGQSAGTTGRSERLEAIWISLGPSSYSGSVTYRTHIQNIGWENGWKQDGQMSGTTGQALRLEAIQIKLTGDIAAHYDIYYRVHAQNFGWLGWAKNGESAGTVGCSYRVEAIQIQLVAKGAAAPGNTSNAFRSAGISYSAHVQNIGWQNNSFDGSSAGKTGKGLRLEAIRISLPEQKYSGSVQYRSHIQNIGWENTWKKNGQVSGTTGKALRLEAIQIKLTGEMESHYDIYYRVYLQNAGWSYWVKNGETAGTSGLSLRVEGIQIMLVKKDGSDGKAPVNTPVVIPVNRYIDQVAEGAPMGCEGASLLMALWSKGYCTGMSYQQFLETMPYASDGNPNHGFVGTPYANDGNFDGINMPAVASWGARYASTADITGCSEEEMIYQLYLGHPVVVWTSYLFGPTEPENYWWGSYKTNAHVMLLCGFNPDTKEFYIADPAPAGGDGIKWVSWTTFTDSFDVMRGAVAVW